MNGEPRTIGGYTVLAPLGEGGMGVVYLARRDDGQRAALKVLRPHVAGDEETRARLEREVGSLRRVRSRWVAEIIDADPWAPVPYIATRYVPGLSLHDQVAREGVVTGNDLMWLSRCLLEGIAAVHEAGVLHRDVKPSNVLMEGRTPVLIDFGLARVADDPKLTRTGWLLGTPGYLAPEVLYGDEATEAVDVHAWAATVAYAATGHPPYGRGPAMAVMDRARRGEHQLAGAPEPLRGVLDAALDPEPGRRPSVPELLDWLRGHGTVPLVRRVPLPRAAGTETMPLAAVLDDPVRPDVTRVLDEEPAFLDHVGYPEEPAPDPADAFGPGPIEWQPEARVGSAVRARRFLLWLALGLVCVAGLTAYPYLGGAAVVALVWLLRGWSSAAAVVGERRRLRGPRWHDGPRLVLAAPWHLVSTLPGSVLLVLWAAGLGVAAGLLCYALAASETVTVPVCAAVVLAGLWWGPGGFRIRSPLGRVLHPLAARPRRWLGALLVMLVAAGLVGGLVTAQGPDWRPEQQSPLEGRLP